MKVSNPKYNRLLNDIGEILQQAKVKVARMINIELVNAYWLIGNTL